MEEETSGELLPAAIPAVEAGAVPAWQGELCGEVEGSDNGEPCCMLLTAADSLESCVFPELQVRSSERRHQDKMAWPPATPFLEKLGVPAGPDLIGRIGKKVEEGKINYLSVGLCLELR